MDEDKDQDVREAIAAKTPGKLSRYAARPDCTWSPGLTVGSGGSSATAAPVGKGPTEIGVGHLPRVDLDKALPPCSSIAFGCNITARILRRSGASAKRARKPLRKSLTSRSRAQAQLARE